MIKGEVSPLSLPHHAGTGQQRQHRAQFLVGEPLELDGQPQLQRLAQFVETNPAPDSEKMKARKMLAQGKAKGGRALALSDALDQPSTKTSKP
jgi:hypothetical protein